MNVPTKLTCTHDETEQPLDRCKDPFRTPHPPSFKWFLKQPPEHAKPTRGARFQPDALLFPRCIFARLGPNRSFCCGNRRDSAPDQATAARWSFGGSRSWTTTPGRSSSTSWSAPPRRRGASAVKGGRGDWPQGTVEGIGRSGNHARTS